MSDLTKAREFMTRPVRKLAPDTLVRDAAAYLIRLEISGAPVVDGRGRLLGVFSLTDLARCVQKHVIHSPGSEPSLGKGRYTFEPFEETRVFEVMTPGVASVFADAPMSEVVETMKNLRIHRVFVLSENGDLVGVITSMDLIRWLADSFTEKRKETRKERV